MAGEKKIRDKAAEKAVKERLKKTHLKSYRIVGSDKKENISAVYILRIVESISYLFKVNCTLEGSGYNLSGLIPVNDKEEIGEYKVYNPQYAAADALRPTEKEKKFAGYNN